MDRFFNLLKLGLMSGLFVLGVAHTFFEPGVGYQLAIAVFVIAVTMFLYKNRVTSEPRV